MESLTAHSRGVTTAQGTLLLVGVVSIVGVGFAQFFYGAPEYASDRIILSIGLAVVAVVSFVLYPWMRRRQARELTIDQDGMRVKDHLGERRWTWNDLQRVGYVHVGAPNTRTGPILTIVDEEASRGSGHAKNAQVLVALGNAPQGATLVPVGHLGIDEQRVLTAIQHFSDGRFPEVKPIRSTGNVDAG